MRQEGLAMAMEDSISCMCQGFDARIEAQQNTRLAKEEQTIWQPLLLRKIDRKLKAELDRLNATAKVAEEMDGVSNLFKPGHDDDQLQRLRNDATNDFKAIRR